MSGLIFDVFPADDVNGTALGELTEAYDKSFQGVHQAIGSGQFTVNRSSSQAAWAVADNLVRVRRVAGGPFAYDDARYIGAFWIETGKRVLLSSDEEGGRDLTMGGRGPEAALRWAVLYPDAFDSRNDQYTTQVPNDGNWHIKDVTAGEVLTIFLRDVAARSPSPLPFITRDFTVNHDSIGAAWSDVSTDWSIPVGTNGLDLLSTCVSGGLFYRVGADMKWHAYEVEPGTNHSGTITLSEAAEIAVAADQDVTARDTVGRVVVQGTTKGGKMKYREVVNAGVEAGLPGRREGFVEYKATPTNAKLDQAGNRYIRKTKRHYDGPLQISYVERTGAIAFADFVPGDIVKVNIPGAFNNASLRVYAITLEEDDAGNVTPVVDFEQSPFDPNSGNQAEMGDNGGKGSKCGDCPPIPPFVPCSTPGDTSSTPGGIIYEPGDGTESTALLQQIFWASNGDSPGTGYAGQPRDATNFAYIGTLGHQEGWEILADTVSLDLHLKANLVDTFLAPPSSITYTLQLLLNGAVIATDVQSAPPGFVLVTFTIDITGLAVVAGDRLTTWMATSHATNYIVPSGTGVHTNVFEILNTSTIGSSVPCAPLEGQGHLEQLAGDGSTTAFQTNYPYAPNSLEVHVNGLLTPVTETDPATGSFTFASAPPLDAVIVVTYQNAGTTPTGATNPVPTASTPASGLTVKDEGTPLATLATSIDFAGAGVSATGSGADKTVTVSAELPFEGGQSLIKPHGSMGSTETFDPTDGNVHTGTLDANCTVTLSPPAGAGACTIEGWITEDATGGRTIAWSGSVTEQGTHDTTLSTTQRFVAETIDGGTSWIVTWIGSGSSFATPAIVLGSSAAAGAATTVIRSDATIAAFDATVPVTQAFSDAAATGSAAFAARRDHKHGMPATPASGGAADHEHILNVVFSGDGSTTAWELPAAPVDASSIAVYVTAARSIAWALSGTLLTTLTFDSAPASAANNIVIDIVAAVA